MIVAMYPTVVALCGPMCTSFGSALHVPVAPCFLTAATLPTCLDSFGGPGLTSPWSSLWPRRHIRQILTMALLGAGSAATQTIWATSGQTAWPAWALTERRNSAGVPFRTHRCVDHRRLVKLQRFGAIVVVCFERSPCELFFPCPN